MNIQNIEKKEKNMATFEAAKSVKKRKVILM